MVTVNISITSSEHKLIDELVKKYDYANRSEFFRAILRLIMNDKTMLKKVVTFPRKMRVSN